MRFLHASFCLFMRNFMNAAAVFATIDSAMQLNVGLGD